MRTPFICGNWKMYKTIAEAREFATSFKAIYENRGNKRVKVAICGPYLTLQTLSETFRGTGIEVGAENVHYEKEGAYTGEVSAHMLSELGLQYCIVGHSERRRYFGELDDDCLRKIKALLEADIKPILCVGEDLFQREHNYQNALVSEQVKNALKGIPGESAEKIVIAYEPIWAIGTGRTATPIQAGQMCTLIRNTLEEIYGREISEKMLVLYGGSVKPENASEILNMENVDGALVGGASLEPLKFIEIVNF